MEAVIKLPSGTKVDLSVSNRPGNSSFYLSASPGVSRELRILSRFEVSNCESGKKSHLLSTPSLTMPSNMTMVQARVLMKAGLEVADLCDKLTMEHEQLQCPSTTIEGILNCCSEGDWENANLYAIISCSPMKKLKPNCNWNYSLTKEQRSDNVLSAIARDKRFAIVIKEMVHLYKVYSNKSNKISEVGNNLIIRAYELLFKKSYQGTREENLKCLEMMLRAAKNIPYEKYDELGSEEKIDQIIADHY